MSKTPNSYLTATLRKHCPRAMLEGSSWPTVLYGSRVKVKEIKEICAAVST